MQEEIEVSKTDTPEDVAKKVLKVEHQIYPQVIKKIIEENLRG
jgi:phosphoribosylglycinamide formyltransferase-1